MAKKLTRKSIALILIIAALLLAGGGTGAWYFLSHRKLSPPVPRVEATFAEFASGFFARLELFACNPKGGGNGGLPIGGVPKGGVAIGGIAGGGNARGGILPILGGKGICGGGGGSIYSISITSLSPFSSPA